VIYYRRLILSCIINLLFLIGSSFGQRLVNVEQFGATADAREINGVWVGTDNSPALNKCAAYCRAKGLTMFFPKGNYGVASTVWLTNPKEDGHKQASITVIGPNRGAYKDQSDSAKLCILSTFKAGSMVNVKKSNGAIVKEPDIVPVLGINNGRKVHVQGVTVHGNNKTDLISAVTIGNYSLMTTFQDCSFENIYAGIVYPGIRDSRTGNVIEGNNDLLFVERCTFRNAYNVVCGGTQPFNCEFRNSIFFCWYSVFTGTLITNIYGQSEGSAKFTCNQFQSLFDVGDRQTVYFDLRNNAVIVDTCRFETTTIRTVPEVMVRHVPLGGVRYRRERVAFVNNHINFRFVNQNPKTYLPLIDSMANNQILLQNNVFEINTVARIKANQAILIGNTFVLGGSHNLEVTNDVQILNGDTGNIARGKYSFYHLLRKDAKVTIKLPNGKVLKENEDYTLSKDENAFVITPKGKKNIDQLKAKNLIVHYTANDAAGVSFESWAATLNPPYGWQSKNMILLGNKVITKTDDGTTRETDLLTSAVSQKGTVLITDWNNPRSAELARRYILSQNVGTSDLNEPAFETKYENPLMSGPANGDSNSTRQPAK
jgi:hypothetical protein